MQNDRLTDMELFAGFGKGVQLIDSTILCRVAEISENGNEVSLGSSDGFEPIIVVKNVTIRHSTVCDILHDFKPEIYLS